MLGKNDFKKMIKNYDFLSYDVVTFALRIATFRMHNEPSNKIPFLNISCLKKKRVLLLKINAIKHLKVKSKNPIILKTLWIEEKFLQLSKIY